jgi:hypothetical protein
VSNGFRRYELNVFAEKTCAAIDALIQKTCAVFFVVPAVATLLLIGWVFHNFSVSRFAFGLLGYDGGIWVTTHLAFVGIEWSNSPDNASFFCARKSLFLAQFRVF